MIYYVAHPLGTGTDRIANIARAKRWLKYLLETYPDDAFMMPWIPYAEVLTDCAMNHERGLRDDLEILNDCQGLVLCGGTISPGMRKELVHFAQLTDPCREILDLIDLGPEPPSDG